MMFSCHSNGTFLEERKTVCSIYAIIILIMTRYFNKFFSNYHLIKCEIIYFPIAWLT